MARKPLPRRPDLTGYFKSRIDWHTHGLMARMPHSLPNGVLLKGDVTDRLITATDRDGIEWYWEGGKYARRKIEGCYAPLMPRPLKVRPPQPLPDGKHGHCKAVTCYNRIQFVDTCSNCGGPVTVEEGCCE